MLVDLHIHESTYSANSKITLKEIIEEAKRKGLQGVCITDHDNNYIEEKAIEISKELNYPVFVGVEYLTYDGDIVAFGLDEVPNVKMSAQEFVELVISEGGVCISAHPYRNNNRGLEDKIKIVKGLSAIEAFNGNTDDENNKKAFYVSKELNIQAIGASDAHHLHKVGKFATLLPYEVYDTQGLIKAIKSNECKPAIYKDGKYIIVK